MNREVKFFVKIKKMCFFWAGGDRDWGEGVRIDVNEELKLL